MVVWRPEAWRTAADDLGLAVTWESLGRAIRIDVALGVDELPEQQGEVLPVARPASPDSFDLPAPAPAPIAGNDGPIPRGYRETSVLAVLADGKAWSRRELDVRLGWSRSTLRNVLESLVRAGRVVAEAPSPRSPFQAYRLASVDLP